jgi:hypothetical protein
VSDDDDADEALVVTHRVDQLRHNRSVPITPLASMERLLSASNTNGAPRLRRQVSKNNRKDAVIGKESLNRPWPFIAASFGARDFGNNQRPRRARGVRVTAGQTRVSDRQFPPPLPG